MKFIYYDEMAEFTIKQWEFLLSKERLVFYGGDRGGKSDWIRRLFMVDGPGVSEQRREDAQKRQEVERQAVNQASESRGGALAHGIVGRGNFYMNSIRRELEIRRSKLQMEIDMVDTALSLCTEEAEKTIQLQQILSRLDKH